MNERIKELAEQANKRIRYRIDANSFKHIDDTNGAFTRFEFDKEKFAELIVRECLEIIEPCRCGCCDGEPEGIITSVIIKQIKERFGVKDV